MRSPWGDPEDTSFRSSILSSPAPPSAPARLRVPTGPRPLPPAPAQSQPAPAAAPFHAPIGPCRRCAFTNQLNSQCPSNEPTLVANSVARCRWSSWWPPRGQERLQKQARRPLTPTNRWPTLNSPPVSEPQAGTRLCRSALDPSQLFTVLSGSPVSRR